MPADISIAYGANDRLSQKIGDVRVLVSDGPQIELVASILPDPMIAAPGHLPPTSITIHMDPSVAAVLLDRLKEALQPSDRGPPLGDHPLAGDIQRQVLTQPRRPPRTR